MSAGVGYESSAGRDTSGLGNAWGTRGGSFIRSILNACIPVSIIERWYGELDGSLFGGTAGTLGGIGFRPAVEYWSDTRDWELHSLQVIYPQMLNTGGTGGPFLYRVNATLYTAHSGFNPVEFNPTAIFGPQLVTNTNFDQGTVRSQAGLSPINNPFGQGWVMSSVRLRVGLTGANVEDDISDAPQLDWQTAAGPPITYSAYGVDKKLQNSIWFHRPLRIRRGRRITIQLQMLDATSFYNPPHSLVVSALYSELPNPRGSYMTPP